MPAIAQVDSYDLLAQAHEPTRSAARRGWSGRRLVAAVAGVGGGAALGTAVGLAAIFDEPANPGTVNLATASASAVIAALGAYLFFRRMQRTRALVDVLLTAAIALLAILAAAIAVYLAMENGEAPVAQLAMTIGPGLIVSIGFAVASFLPDRAAPDPRASAERLLVIGFFLASAAAAGAVAITYLNADAVTGELPDGARAALEAIAAVCCLVAAVGFVRRSASGQGPVMAWLAFALAIWAMTHLSAGLLPWTGGDPSSVQIVQLAGLAALLAAGLRDFEWAQHRRAEQAVVDERRRMARELHDGLAQELAYITSESRRLSTVAPTEHLANAAERALEESRAAIAALARPASEPFERTVAATAQSLAARAGVEVVVAVRPGLDIAPDTRQALLRIVREGMSNAIRHGHATTLHVSVDGPSPLVLAIADNGDGFRVDFPARPDSFGLLSMRERAENLGGHLTIESDLGHGTTIAVVLP